MFKLNSKARCSCGSRKGVNPTVTEILVYTMSRAIPLLIETTYCLRCPNKKGRVGPDLGEFGVFNYNNRCAFSHFYCKDEPVVIIADGVSIGFSNDKVVRLKAPTICDKEMGQVVRVPKRNSRRLL